MKEYMLKKRAQRIRNLVNENRKIYYELIINDFKSKYNGSFLGMIWGIIQPIVTILIYCVVFQYGLRSGERPDGVPYVFFMISGAVPWFFFSEAWGGITTSFLDYSYLVKKLHFEIKLLPLVKLGSALIIHIIFVAFTIVILNFNGYHANWYYLQIIYYLFATIVFTVLIGIITASLAVYIRDIIQVVGIMIQIGFWAVPICWGSEVQIGIFGAILKLNPMYYCVEGYRKSLIYRRGFWAEPFYTIYFWCIMLLLFGLATYMYKKLRPNFSDVM